MALALLEAAEETGGHHLYGLEDPKNVLNFLLTSTTTWVLILWNPCCTSFEISIVSLL